MFYVVEQFFVAFSASKLYGIDATVLKFCIFTVFYCLYKKKQSVFAFDDTTNDSLLIYCLSWFVRA